jgi:hypothetical protein
VIEAIPFWIVVLCAGLTTYDEFVNFVTALTFALRK